MKLGKGPEGTKGYLDSQGNDDEEYNESEDDLLDSKELEEFIKDDEFIPSPAQEKKKMNINVPDDASKNAGVKKGGPMEGDLAEGVRRSSRLESTEEMKIVDKADARAMAKDAFINKGTSYNPFSVLNTDNVVLMDVVHRIGVDLGSPAKRDFGYELCWRLRPKFRTLVVKNWSLPVRSKKSIDIWKEKTKRLKKMLKGWNINVEGRYLKLKKDLMEKLTF
jgi:hypothetical protein